MTAAASALAATAGLPRWQPAYIGIGSNLDGPREQVERALAALERVPRSRLVLSSPLYRTAPFGEVAQPPYVNAVAALLTQLAPEELLGELRRLETELGRGLARERWGPRRIDLDLLVLGGETRATAIAPDLEVPGLGRVDTLRARVVNRGVQRL